LLFEVLLWNEAGTEGAILEVYADAAAREAHRATPLLAEMKRVLAGLRRHAEQTRRPALGAGPIRSFPQERGIGGANPLPRITRRPPNPLYD
jgi:hypothetical protein